MPTKFRIVEAMTQYVGDPEGEHHPCLVMVDEEGDVLGFHSYDGDMTIVEELKVLAEFETQY